MVTNACLSGIEHYYHHCFDRASDGRSIAPNHPGEHRRTLRFACGGQLTRAIANSGEEMATPILMLPQHFQKTVRFPE